MDSSGDAADSQAEMECDDGGEEPEQQMTIVVDSSGSETPATGWILVEQDTGNEEEDKVLEKSDPDMDLIGENMEVTSEIRSFEQEQNSLGSSCSSSSSDDDMKVVTKDEEKDDKDEKVLDCSDEKTSDCSDEKPAVSPSPRSKYSLRTRRPSRNSSVDSTWSFPTTRRRRKFFFFHDELNDCSADKKSVGRPRKNTTRKVISSPDAVAVKALKGKPKEDQDGVNFKCTYCDRSYSRRRDLKQHVVSHTSDACKCLVCFKTFTTVKGTKQHMREQHKDSKVFTCPRCSTFTTLSEEDLRTHLAASHNEIVKSVRRSGGGFQGSKRKAKVVVLNLSDAEEGQGQMTVSNKDSPRRSSRIISKIKVRNVAASVENSTVEHEQIENEQSRESWCPQELQNSPISAIGNRSISSSISTYQSVQNGPRRELNCRFTNDGAGPIRLRCERCERSFFMQRMLDRHLCLGKGDFNSGEVKTLEFNPFSLTISGCNVHHVKNTKQKVHRRPSIRNSIPTDLSSVTTTNASSSSTKEEALPLATPTTDTNPLPTASPSTTQTSSEITYKCRQCPLEFPRPMLLVIHEHCVHRRAAKNGKGRKGTLRKAARKNILRRDSISHGNWSPFNQSSSGSSSSRQLSSANYDRTREEDSAKFGTNNKLTKVVIYLGS